LRTYHEYEQKSNAYGRHVMNWVAYLITTFERQWLDNVGWNLKITNGEKVRFWKETLTSFKIILQ
jgi:hypothetical protein